MKTVNPNRKLITLEEFTDIESEHFTNSTGELATLIKDISLACKIINEKVSKAGLQDIIGAYGKVNVQGEEQMKLDVFSNDVLIDILKTRGDCAGLASEENDEIIAFDDEESLNGKYVVLFDPLDGSSNIDVNAGIGTIFCIYKRISPLGKPCTIEDFLQKGKNIMAAGYVIYGSSTMMVYATKLGVNGFTLDPSLHQFCLSHRNMKCPEDGKIYSLNQGNFYKYDASFQKYLEHCMTNTYTHRYIGSMVGDVHRTLIKGGVFAYPHDAKNANGKLRLLYECNPMSFLIEMAGGKSSDGSNDSILEIQPTELHQRVPIYLGSKNMVEELKGFIN